MIKSIEVNQIYSIKIGDKYSNFTVKEIIIENIEDGNFTASIHFIGSDGMHLVENANSVISSDEITLTGNEIKTLTDLVECHGHYTEMSTLLKARILEIIKIDGKKDLKYYTKYKLMKFSKFGIKEFREFDTIKKINNLK